MQMPAGQQAPLRFERLTSQQRPLLDKFYRHHRSPMRATGEQSWVARREEIITALNLALVADGHWLTGLFSAPTERCGGVASALVQTALESLDGPTWLFCQPSLRTFYQRLGFEPCESLPQTLADRLQRYRRKRALLAMVRPPRPSMPAS